MAAYATQERTFTGADIAAVLDELTAHATDPAGLRAWADGTTTPIARLRATHDLAYVRLDGRDRRGSQVVLMLLDDVWERTM